jgi:hypothetical protein
MLVGRILRRHASSRDLLIGYQDVNGNESTTRIWGLKRKAVPVQVWRVVGIFIPMPF